MQAGGSLGWKLVDGPVVDLGAEDTHGQDGPSTIEVSL
jgi:hypothetical protein